RASNSASRRARLSSGCSLHASHFSPSWHAARARRTTSRATAAWTKSASPSSGGGSAALGARRVQGAEEAVQGRGEDRGAHGLLHELLDVRLLADQLDALLVHLPAGHDDDRDVAGADRLHLAQDLVAAEAREHHVENDEVGLEGL